MPRRVRGILSPHQTHQTPEKRRDHNRHPPPPPLHRLRTLPHATCTPVHQRLHHPRQLHSRRHTRLQQSHGHPRHRHAGVPPAMGQLQRADSLPQQQLRNFPQLRHSNHQQRPLPRHERQVQRDKTRLQTHRAGRHMDPRPLKHTTLHTHRQLLTPEKHRAGHALPAHRQMPLPSPCPRLR